MIKNYVIEYEDWDSYNAETKEEAINRFVKEHPDSRILGIRGGW